MPNQWKIIATILEVKLSYEIQDNDTAISILKTIIKLKKMAHSQQFIPSPHKISLKKLRSIDRQTTTRRVDVNLNAQEIGDEAIPYLVSKDLDHIVTMKLWKNNLTFEGMIALTSNNQQWNNLKQLFLNSNTLGNKGSLYLSKASWQSLQTLSLYANQIDNYGCSHLAKKNWSTLKEINLDKNHIRSFDQLNKIKADNLVKINIDLNPITFVGYMSLVKSQWVQVQELILINNFFKMKSVVIRKHLKDKYVNLRGVSF